MLKREKRIQELALYLKLNNASSIKELSDKFKVSEMTVRRDLYILESKKIVRFIHGGAVFNPEYDPPLAAENNDQQYYGSNYLFNQQIVKHKEEKIAIAKKAASLIEPDETVMIDSGTTMTYLCREIDNNFPFTAICWSLNVLVELSKKPNCKLISYGGYFHSETVMFENPYPSEFVKYTRASKIFVSAGGLHPELGITCPKSYESETKQISIQSSKTSILLIDSSKFGKISSTHFANLEDFDIIITDSHVDESFKKDIESRGVQLILA